MCLPDTILSHSTLTVKYLAFAVTCWDFTVSKVYEGYTQGHPLNIIYRYPKVL